MTVLGNGGTLKSMLDRDLTTVLLAQQSTHYRPLQPPQRVPRDVIRYGEEDEGMEGSLKPGIRRLLRRQQRVLHDVWVAMDFRVPCVLATSTGVENESSAAGGRGEDDGLCVGEEEGVSSL